METITLAGGCFWCTETVFKFLRGVEKVEPGYSGGNVENPDYYDVASGKTGHAESVQVIFDPKTISLKTLLNVFFKLHDPTQLNGQGVDIGTQYRSAIFFNSENQRKVAVEALERAQKDYKKTIVTEITPFINFYKAPEEHRDYYFKNKGNIYCRIVIDPKLNKLKKEFAENVKK